MNLTTAQARRWVLLSLVGLLGMAAYKGNLGGDRGLAYRLWGVGMLGLMLSAAADFVPQVAGPFAVLVLLGYATAGGDKAIENVLGKVSGGAPSGAPPAAVTGSATAAPTTTNTGGQQ